MSAGATYRQHALDCLRLAQVASAPRDKAVLAEMAATWMRLADFVETIAGTLRDELRGDGGDARSYFLVERSGKQTSKPVSGGAYRVLSSLPL